MESANAVENNEQAYQAELLRERARARAKEAALLDESNLSYSDQEGASSSKNSRYGLVGSILILEFSLIVDFIQFMVHTYTTLLSLGFNVLSAILPALRAIRIAVGVLGWTLGVSAYVLEWAISIVIGLTFLLLLLWKRVSIVSRTGVAVYNALFFAVLGESILSIAPVWTGFAIFMIYKLRPNIISRT